MKKFIDKRNFFQIERVTNTRSQKSISATVFIGNNKTPLEKCNIIFVKEIFEIESHVLLQDRDNVSEECQSSPVKSRSKFLMKTKISIYILHKAFSSYLFLIIF